MSRYLYSFVSGLGSLLSVWTLTRHATFAESEMEAIGGDFTRVGADLQKGIDAKAQALTAGYVPTPDAIRKEEQLEFQGV